LPLPPYEGRHPPKGANRHADHTSSVPSPTALHGRFSSSRSSTDRRALRAQGDHITGLTAPMQYISTDSLPRVPGAAVLLTLCGIPHTSSQVTDGHLHRLKTLVREPQML
jgi:hypothetical protein